jgi:hypothetical protein
MVLAFLGSGLAPLVTIAASESFTRYRNEGKLSLIYNPALVVIAAVVLVMALAAYFLLCRLEPSLEQNAAEEATFLDTLPLSYVDLAIFGSAALSLFLELAIIRWQATVFEFFAFYKNFSLLACFAGLGLGYALSGQKRIRLVLTIPALCWEFALMIAMRYGMSEAQFASLTVLPFREQLNMGISAAPKFYYASQTYFVIAIIFLLTVIAFLPIGQLCGALMQRREKLRAYGLNLLGSLAGVVMMFTVSAFWTPPVVWFIIAFVGLLLFLVRTRRTILFGAGSATVALIILSWPVNPLWQRIYSPYQLIEVGYQRSGLMVIRAAGHYYQQVKDLSRTNRSVENEPILKNTRNYYELPYQIYGHPQNVAIVGAGTGNDVAAALRSGAQRVDAIEIDPVILRAGEIAHPEHPYSDPRVHAIINDARSFLRTTNSTYDIIAYGLLDSHTLLSQASSVRLDSFVYTVQALREARARLRPHGLLSLSFAVLDEALGRKIYLMLTEAFDGHAPISVQAGYDKAVVFLESTDSSFVLPDNLLENTGFRDQSSVYGNPQIQADPSTDDWPFLYMPRRVYPRSYLVMVLLVFSLTLFLVGNFSREALQFSLVPFFLLGAGFMLVETKGITELGLTFGNSWQVIGIVIGAIMLMSFLANCVVQWWNVKRPAVPYLLLVASLALGWLVALNGGLPSTWAGRIGTAAVLTLPMFFSGIVFSTLLRSRGEISGIMATNLFGAMCGGLLEYNSMFFGFRFLYLMAAALYLLAFLWDLFRLEGVAERPMAAVRLWKA